MAGWQEVKVGDFITLEYGKPLDRAKRKADGLYPAYGANGVNCRSDEYFYDEKTIIVGRKGSAGEITLTEAKFWPLDVTYFIKFDKAKYELMFIYYLLSQLNLPSLATGVKPGINRNNVYAIKVKVPKIEEQKRIVAILDEAFADIEQVRAKTEQNLKNARELFESYLQQVFSQRGEGWVEYKMSEVCAITSKLIDPKDLEYLDLPHVGAGNMVSGTGELVDVKTAREEGLISGKFSFDSSMVLYSKIRPYLMKVCRPDFSGLCSADVYPLVPIDGLLDKDYLFYLLLSQDFTEYAVSGSGRAGMPKVNRTHLFNYSLSAPSIDSQREYVVKMDQILEYSQALESVYSLKLKSLDELKKSILQKAFSGELTQKNNQGAVA